MMLARLEASFHQSFEDRIVGAVSCASRAVETYDLCMTPTATASGREASSLGASSLNFPIRCLAAPRAGVFRFPSQINLASHGASSMAFSLHSVCRSGLQLAQSLPQLGRCLPWGFTPSGRRQRGFPTGSDLRWPNFSQILGVASKFQASAGQQFAKRHVIQAGSVMQRLSAEVSRS